MGLLRRRTSSRLLRWIMGCLMLLGLTPLLLNDTAKVRTGALISSAKQSLNLQYTNYIWEPHRNDILHQNLTNSSYSHKAGHAAVHHKAPKANYVKERTMPPSSRKDQKHNGANVPDHSASQDNWDAQCEGVPTPVVLLDQLRKHSWQSGNDMKQVRIFSAFFDGRKGTGEVQVVGMYNGYTKSIPKFCHLVYKTGPGGENGGESYREGVSTHHLSVYITNATAFIVSRATTKRYSPVIFTCPLQFPGTPLGVSIVSGKCHVGNASVYLKVQDDHLTQPLYNFTVCVAPLYHTDISNMRRFIEHVEINKVFGADRFVYYNHSVGSELKNALGLYGLEGLNEVIQWTLPVEKEEVIYYAQIASQNDCLLRYMYKSRYVVFTDLDELIVPRNSTNWYEMIDQTIKLKGRLYASYVIRNVFFHLEFSDHQNALKDVDVQALQIMPLKKLQSEAPQKIGHRAKYICDPRLSLSATVHSLVKATIKHRHVFVPDNLAMLHHYRDWGVKEGTQNRTLDMSMYRFRDLIVSNIRKAHKKLDILPLKVRPSGSQ